MESIGSRLKKAREERGYSIEQVSRETNIARKYLRALENEDFSDFPGDTYLLGFLRNYSDYLGLDSDEMVAFYKNLKIQEQPAPIEELLEPPRSGKFPVILIAFLLIAAAGLGAFYKFYYLPSSAGGAEKVSAEVKKEPEQQTAEKRKADLELKDSVVEKYFKEGAVVSVPVDGKNLSVVFKSAGDDVVLSYPAGEGKFKLGKRQPVDLDGDGNVDIYITVNDIDKNAGGAVLRFDRFINESMDKDNREAAADTENAGEKKAVNLGSTNNASRKKPVKVILSAEKEEPFILDMTFRGYCFVRSVVDNGRREEQYFNKGETLRLDVTESVQLWISNAGIISARLSGKDVVFGRPGEVVSYLIKWDRNRETGKFELRMIPVY